MLCPSQDSGITVYKAVILSEGKYYSIMKNFLPKTLTAHYRIGRVTIPVVGQLMAFEMHTQARRFAASACTNGESWAILQCKAGVAPREGRSRMAILNLVYKSNPHSAGYAIRKYWKKSYEEFIMDSPYWVNTWEVSAGTVFCTWILPEKEVMSNVRG